MTAPTVELTDYQQMRAVGYAPRTVTCPKCKAHPGQECQSTGGGNPRPVADHRARLDRVAHWTPEQRLTFGALVIRQGRTWWANMPAGYYAEPEAAAKPVAAKPAKPVTPRGVQLSQPQADRIELAAEAGGRYTVSTAHFHGDAADRQSVQALAAKRVFELVGEENHGWDRVYKLTDFGWQVYGQHRLISRRLPEAADA